MRAFLFRTILLAFGVSLTGQAYPSSSPAAGGTFQRSSVEGCMNENLFNGIWRVKALAVEENVSFQEGTRVTGTGVTLQVRNGTTKDLAPDETGFSDINGHGIYLAYSDDNTVEMSSIGSGYAAKMGDKKLPPGAASTTVLYFPAPGTPSAKPTKLLIKVDPTAHDNYRHVKYSVKDPSFRVHLDCTK